MFVLRYNMLTATAINGAVMPNVSSGRGHRDDGTAVQDGVAAQHGLTNGAN